MVEEAHKYFVDYISKAYQALTDPVSRENCEKYGHPDGRQSFKWGSLFRSFFSISMSIWWNFAIRNCRSLYSFAPNNNCHILVKVIKVYRELCYASNNVCLLPFNEAFISSKTDLLMQAHLTHETTALSPSLECDFKKMLVLAPRLLEELVKMAIIPRTQLGHGWLRPAIGVVELSKSIIQAVPLCARKATEASSEGYGPFLQLPHFSESVVKKFAGKKVRSFQDFREMNQLEEDDYESEYSEYI